MTKAPKTFVYIGIGMIWIAYACSSSSKSADSGNNGANATGSPGKATAGTGAGTGSIAGAGAGTPAVVASGNLGGSSGALPTPMPTSGTGLTAAQIAAFLSSPAGAATFTSLLNSQQVTTMLGLPAGSLSFIAKNPQAIAALLQNPQIASMVNQYIAGNPQLSSAILAAGVPH